MNTNEEQEWGSVKVRKRSSRRVWMRRRGTGDGEHHVMKCSSRVSLTAAECRKQLQNNGQLGVLSSNHSSVSSEPNTTFFIHREFGQNPNKHLKNPPARGTPPPIRKTSELTLAEQTRSLPGTVRSREGLCLRGNGGSSACSLIKTCTCTFGKQRARGTNKQTPVYLLE